MWKTEKHFIASLCLSAVFCTLLTPALFLLHADNCGVFSSPASEIAFLNVNAASGSSLEHIGHSRPRTGSAHNQDACMQCQAFLQYLSGATTGQAQEIAGSSLPAHILRADAALSLFGERFSSFLSRAPPVSSGSLRS